MNRTGIYPGTFDPPHNGHRDIIGRALRLVDHLVIGVAVNDAKGPVFTLDERVALVEAEARDLAAAIPGHATIRVQPFKGLLVDLAKSAGAQVIIRGLRSSTDYDYERQMVGMNSRMAPGVETIFLTADAQYQAITGTLVREIARMGGDITPFVSPAVAQAIAKKLAKG